MRLLLMPLVLPDSSAKPSHLTGAKSASARPHYDRGRELLQEVSLEVTIAGHHLAICPNPDKTGAHHDLGPTLDRMGGRNVH